MSPPPTSSSGSADQKGSSLRTEGVAYESIPGSRLHRDPRAERDALHAVQIGQRRAKAESRQEFLNLPSNELQAHHCRSLGCSRATLEPCFETMRRTRPARGSPRTALCTWSSPWRYSASLEQHILPVCAPQHSWSRRSEPWIRARCCALPSSRGTCGEGGSSISPAIDATQSSANTMRSGARPHSSNGGDAHKRPGQHIGVLPAADRAGPAGAGRRGAPGFLKLCWSAMDRLSPDMHDLRLTLHGQLRMRHREVGSPPMLGCTSN